MAKRSKTTRHFKKGSSVSKIILEKLGELGEITLDAFFPKKYAHTAIWRPLLGLDRPRKITRHIVSMNLSRLRREGLVEKSSDQRMSGWHLTKRGKILLSSQISNDRIIPAEDGIRRLVIFDVPEHKRERRDVIRAELIESGFRQLQKSVWIGERPLTKEFISLLDDHNLAKCVHIFSVRSEGTLSGQ